LDGIDTFKNISDDGMYLLSPTEVEEKGIEIGQRIELNVGRIDLVAMS
jgi:hypothetical protein